MLRRLFTILSTISLLLCAATVVLWVRSYAVVDDVQRITGPDRYILSTAGGGFALQATTDQAFQAARQGWRWQESAGQSHVDSQLHWNRSVMAQDPSQHTYLGFWWSSLWGPNSTTPTATTTLVVIGPIWPLSAILAVVPTAWLVIRAKRRKATRRRIAGLCPICGYDLRATRNRCPECGAVSGYDT
jgi:hypothetical protein